MSMDTFGDEGNICPEGYVSEETLDEAIADEREACAKIVEGGNPASPSNSWGNFKWRGMVRRACQRQRRQLAAQVRARS